jgi:hypothetical protein
VKNLLVLCTGKVMEGERGQRRESQERAILGVVVDSNGKVRDWSRDLDLDDFGLVR